MEKEQIKKIVREATDKHLYVVNGITVEAFEKTLIETLYQALSMSGVSNRRELLLAYHLYLVADGIQFPIALDAVYVDEFLESKQ